MKFQFQTNLYSSLVFGGQIQRIRIARPLFSASEVFALNEASSSKDTKTEEALIKTIAIRNTKLPVFVISHKSSTLEAYERIVKVQNNSITEKNKL